MNTLPQLEQLLRERYEPSHEQALGVHYDVEGASTPSLDRITRNPKIMVGKPGLRGIRVTAGTVLGLVAASYSNAKILAAYLMITLRKRTPARRLPVPLGAWRGLKCPSRRHEIPD